MRRHSGVAHAEVGVEGGLLLLVHGPQGRGARPFTLQSEEERKRASATGADRRGR